MALLGIVAFLLLGWTVLIAVHTGLGLLLRSLFGAPCRDAGGLFDAFIGGWAATVAALQLLNLFLPVSSAVFWSLAAIGCIGLASHRQTALAALATLPLPAARSERVLTLTTLLLALCALALCAALQSPDYDYGLYHTTAVRWTIEYPEVPGLGNVYARVAHNCASFRYVALIEGSPFAGKSQHLASSTLLAALLLRAALAVVRLRTNASGTAHEVFWLAVLPVLASIMPSASSIAPDVSIGVLTIVITASMVRVALTQIEPAEERDLLVAQTALLAGVGMSVKMSFGPFGLVALTLLLPVWWRRGPGRRQRVLWAVLLAPLLTVLPWSAHSIIMTGYPLYPSPLFPLPVDWRVPLASVINVHNWIRSWGRQSHVSWVFVLYDWNWLPAFVLGILREVLGLPAVYIGIALGLTLLNRNAAKTQAWPGIARAGMVLLPVLAFDVFWLVVAPTLRFNRTGFVLPGAGAIALALYGLREHAKAHSALRTTCTVLGVIALLQAFPNILAAVDAAPHLSGAWSREAAIKAQRPHATYVSEHGVRINHLNGDERFTGVPLPVSPHYEFCARVAYREPGNLRAGFKLLPFAEGMITGFHGSAWPRPGFDRTAPPFWGYEEALGLGPPELAKLGAGGSRVHVRATGSATRLVFDGDGGERVLVLSGPAEQPLAAQQIANVLLNGQKAARQPELTSAHELRMAFKTHPGRNELTLQYEEGKAPPFFETLQIIPPPTDGDEWWWGYYADARNGQ